MLIEGHLIILKNGNVTVKVNTISLVKVPNICTNECGTQDNNNKSEHSRGLAYSVYT